MKFESWFLFQGKNLIRVEVNNKKPRIGIPKAMYLLWLWESCLQPYFEKGPQLVTREGFICTFSLLISLSFTFQSSKFNYSSSSKYCLTRTNNSNKSLQLSFHYLKRDRTRRCFSFSVTCHIRIFWTDCEMIPELIICYWLLK